MAARLTRLVVLGLLVGMVVPSPAAAALVRLPTSQGIAASPVPARGAAPADARSYFGARYYRADLGRFTTVDPVYTWSENLQDPQRWNRYAYVRNNPLKFTDPDGRWIETLWDIANVVMGAKSAVDNFRSGNILSGVVDTGGVIVDAAATVVPVVPGGVGTAIKAARAAERIDDVVDAARTGLRGGETAAAAVGRRAHANYGTALGEAYDTKVILPSGRKPDAVNWATQEVRELKPDNPGALRRGSSQVERYRQELERLTGKAWRAIVDVYTSGGGKQ